MLGRLNGDETKRFTPEGNSLANNVTGGKKNLVLLVDDDLFQKMNGNENRCMSEEGGGERTPKVGPDRRRYHQNLKGKRCKAVRPFRREHAANLI